MGKIGKKVGYKFDYVEKLWNDHIEFGITINRISKELGVSLNTLSRWFSKYLKER